VTEDGAPWTPIGQNDAITWPELNGLFRRKDVATAERYLDTLVDHGITVLRLMLEYAQFDSRFFERPAGRFRPEMIRLWDDLFTMCVDRGLRILLTPYDTFWMWRRWGRHPYNRRNGGPCRNRAGLLLCPESRKLIKGRLEFAVERWGASGALFAWDLWNEIHPIYAENSAGCFSEFISDLSEHVRRIELQRYGRTHPQTVSMFGPHVSMEACIPDSIFRHPLLDFASTHFYAEGTIDSPENTVDAAMAVARLMRQALSETPADRPFFDSETGPIHAFKDHHRTLPEPFDDEYFRHMQWAHFAGGGAGGGMRWPNRNPHSLTPGMRMAQRALARFLPLIDWRRFRRRNLNAEIELAGGDRNGSVRFAACGDPSQAVVWMIRTDTVGPDGMLRRDVTPLQPRIEVPGLDRGRYRIIAWNTSEGVAIGECTCAHRGGALQVDVPPLVADLALAITSELPSEPGRDSSPFLATSAFPDQRGK
jgi:mannan endo-1,4-beta-mannosidase